MDAFAKMDIFFIIATAAVVILTVLIGLLVYRVILFVQIVNRIVTEVQEEAGEIRADIKSLRQDVVREGFRITSLASFFGKTAKRVAKRTIKKSSNT